MISASVVPSVPGRSRPRRYALTCAFAYLVAGAAWIVGSDLLIGAIFDDVALVSRMQSAKGLVFIALSAAWIYAMIRLGTDDDAEVGLPASGTERPRLRLQLLLLAGATTLPLIALLAYNVHREATRDQGMAAESALDLARLIATDAARVVRDTRMTADVLAQRDDVRALDSNRCDPQIAEITRVLPHVANTVTIRADGTVACTGLPLARPISFAGYAHFERTLATGLPSIGGLAKGPISGKWVVPMMSALRDEAGKPNGALVIAVDLARLSPLGAAPAGDESFIALVDATGHVLMRVPDQGRTGVDATGSEIVRTALASGNGYSRARGRLGNDQIFGFARVESAGWVALAGTPARTALAASRESAARSSILGALIVLIALVLAYVAARRIERPMRAIALTARSVAEGDLSRRAPVAGSHETAEVAEQLNRLLDQLPKIESELRESNKRLDLVLGAAQEGIIVSDADDRITFANPAAVALLELPDVSDLPGRSFRELLPDDFPRDAFQSSTDREAGRANRYAVRFRTRAGAPRWLQVSATTLRSDGGAFEGMLAMINDITEPKDVEERLARVTRLYWALSEVNEAIVRTSDRTTLFDKTCRIVVEEGGFVTAFITLLDSEGHYLVPAAAAGATAGVVGREPLSMQPDGPYSHGVLASAIRNGEAEVVNDFLADPRTEPARTIGATLGIRAFAALPLRCEGHVVGALAVYSTEVDYFDIGLTELMRQVADDVSFALDFYARAAARDRAEAEVRELNADLERRVAERTARLTDANRELEAFSYSVSHDLRAPVRSINGFGQILATHAGHVLDAEGKRLLGNIVRSSTHMGRLIDDLLTFAQLGRSAIELRPVALGPVIEGIVEHLRPLLDACGAGVSIAPDLPRVRGEPTLLHQVFSNLLSNAIEYRHPGLRPVIDVGWRDVGARVEIAVSDNGIGIASEHQRKIFEMFVRLHSANAHPGTGIGLALASKAAQLMQGEIAVESTEGSGSTFRVFLDKVLVNEPPAKPAAGPSRNRV